MSYKATYRLADSAQEQHIKRFVYHCDHCGKVQCVSLKRYRSFAGLDLCLICIRRFVLETPVEECWLNCVTVHGE